MPLDVRLQSFVQLQVVLNACVDLFAKYDVWPRWSLN